MKHPKLPILHNQHRSGVLDPPYYRQRYLAAGCGDSRSQGSHPVGGEGGEEPAQEGGASECPALK